MGETILGQVFCSAQLKRLFAASIVLLSFGCSSYDVHVSAAADPGFRVSKSDPIYLMLPKDASVRERQLLPSLKHELCRAKLVVVDEPKSAKWVLGLSHERRAYEFGSTSTSIVVPGLIPLVQTRTKTLHTTASTAYLYLFSAESLGGDGSKPFMVWEASLSAPENIFQVYRPIIFKAVLDGIGLDIERPFRLDKSYLRKVSQCESKQDDVISKCCSPNEAS